MLEQMVTSLLRRFDELEVRAVSYRQGVVTDDSPLSVTLGGATTAYTNVSSLVYVAIGDVVSCLTMKNDMLVIGVLSAASGALNPPGTIVAWAGASDPTGGAWLICDGRSLLRASYATLFAEIGTTYGSADGTHFNIPDLRDRVAVGKSGTISLASSGGAKTVALSTAELASHTHTGPSHTHTGPSHTHTSPYALTPVRNDAAQINVTVTWGVEGGGGSAGTTNSGGTGNTGSGGTGSTGSAGSGTAHNNMQPYLGLNYIVRVL